MTTQHDFAEDIKDKAKQLGQDAKSAIRTEAEHVTAQARDKVADQATNAANAADAAASEFDPNSLQARAAQQVADQIEGLANRMRGTDLHGMTRDVSNFARRNPLLFIGGAALIGFTATRFLKARDPSRIASDRGRSDPWSANTPDNANLGGYDGQS